MKNVDMAVASWDLNYSLERRWWQRLLGLNRAKTRKQLDEMYDRAHRRWQAKN